MSKCDDYILKLNSQKDQLIKWDGCFDLKDALPLQFRGIVRIFENLKTWRLVYNETISSGSRKETHWLAPQKWQYKPLSYINLFTSFIPHISSNMLMWIWRWMCMLVVSVKKQLDIGFQGGSPLYQFNLSNLHEKSFNHSGLPEWFSWSGWSVGQVGQVDLVVQVV